MTTETKVEIVRTIKDTPKVSKVLVRRGDEFFEVSSLAEAHDTGLPETRAFPTDAEGERLSNRDCAGGVLRSRQDVIDELSGINVRGDEERIDELVAAAGGPEQFAIKTLLKMFELLENFKPPAKGN